MQSPVKEAAVARAAQILLYWEERDLQSLVTLLSRITDMDESKDIIIALAMFGCGGFTGEQLESIIAAYVL